MSSKLKAVDSYIARAAPFAQPILRHLRSLVHETCPGVTEVIKWGMPHFDYRGPLFYMAAFKQHVALGFWKQTLVIDTGKTSDAAMGQFGRIGSLDELPPDARLRRYLKTARRLNERGVMPEPSPTSARAPLKVPASLKTALARNARARETFESFSYTARKDYVEWLTEAKTEATRQRRLATALEWLAAGKKRHWKYQR